MITWGEAIDAAIEKYRSEAGYAAAQKRGRNPKFPYVPIIMHTVGGVCGNGYQEQLLGRAFIDRAGAVAHAQFVLDVRAKAFERQLRDPRFRAMREQYGLPHELPVVTGDT